MGREEEKGEPRREGAAGMLREEGGRMGAAEGEERGREGKEEK
jgi:hypothetical protein